MMPWWCQNWIAWVVGFAVGVLPMACALPPTAGEDLAAHCRAECADRGGLRHVDFGTAVDACGCWEEDGE